MKQEIGIYTTTDMDGSQLLDLACEWEGALDQECSAEHLDGDRYLVKVIVETEKDGSQLLDEAYDAEDFGTIDEDETYVLELGD